MDTAGVGLGVRGGKGLMAAISPSTKMHPRATKVDMKQIYGCQDKSLVWWVFRPFPWSPYRDSAESAYMPLRWTYQSTPGAHRMRVPPVRARLRPFPVIPGHVERPWRPKTSAAAGAHTPPGSTVTAGRAMTAPAPAKRGAAAGARRALRAPPRPFVQSSSRLLLRASFPVCWLRGAAVRTSSR